jgi:general secretion pathway protein C
VLLNRRYYAVLNLLVLSVVIYGGVNIFYTLAGSKLIGVKTGQMTTEPFADTATPEKRQAFDQYLAAAQRDLFGAVQDSGEGPSEFNMEDLEPTALNVALLGTVSGDRQNAVAVIQETAKRTQSLYKEGDAIENATILKILRGKVILRVGDKNQILTMEEQSTSSPRRPGVSRSLRPPGGPEPGTTITLDRSTVTQSLENMNELISQVRVRPHYKGGEADGLMLSQIRPNSIFTKMGLRNGDIIQGVDGEPVTSPDEIMGLYEELKSGSSVSLQIGRRGQKRTLNYRFK